MTSEINIAVGGIGAPLGQSILRAALNSERKYKLFCCDLDQRSSRIFPGVEFTKLEAFSSDSYEDVLSRFLTDNRISLFFSGSEAEMLFLAGDRQRRIERATGARFALSSLDSLHVGTDKLKTVELLEKIGMPHPRTIILDDDLQTIEAFCDEVGFPVVVKGKRSGSPIVAKNMEDIVYLSRNYENGIIQEFLGDENSNEFTVGVFNDPSSNFIETFCMRRELKYGLTWRGTYEKNEKIENYAKRAVKELGGVGSINVQFREHEDDFFIHEFNVRCSSTTVFRSLAGWNEIDMAVDVFLHGVRPSNKELNYFGEAVRYFEESWTKNSNGN